ncbi:hypothetical protein NDU88_000197 [Pleurodeles waltl]|uniref:Uncharacterized protein n=1 Tax=Pleurodeles waltl TaxID=8319 RepID=A0AAV7LTY9_PLEWA|nr:hypothetical protein NDU88_000197 [Pleurodeles waltl]
MPSDLRAQSLAHGMTLRLVHLPYHLLNLAISHAQRALGARSCPALIQVPLFALSPLCRARSSGLWAPCMAPVSVPQACWCHHRGIPTSTLAPPKLTQAVRGLQTPRHAEDLLREPPEEKDSRRYLPNLRTNTSYRIFKRDPPNRCKTPTAARHYWGTGPGRVLTRGEGRKSAPAAVATQPVCCAKARRPEEVSPALHALAGKKKTSGRGECSEARADAARQRQQKALLAPGSLRPS